MSILYEKLYNTGSHYNKNTYFYPRLMSLKIKCGSKANIGNSIIKLFD